MLIIPIGLARDPSFGSSGANNPSISASGWAGAFADRSRSVVGGGRRRGPDGSFEMRDLKVEITQVVEHDGEYGSDLAASEPDADVKRAGPLDVDGDLDVEAGAYRQQGKAADRSFAV